MSLVASRTAHIATIAKRMRAVDELECAAFGFTPKAALRRSLAASSITLTAIIDGRPEAMMGVEVRSAIEGLGAPWMLATDVAFRHGRDLVALGPIVVAAMCDFAPRLSNVVSQDNHRAIRMLRRWSFEVGDTVQMIGGHAFVTFGMDTTTPIFGARKSSMSKFATP